MEENARHIPCNSYFDTRVWVPRGVLMSALRHRKSRLLKFKETAFRDFRVLLFKKNQTGANSGSPKAGIRRLFSVHSSGLTNVNIFQCFLDAISLVNIF